MMPLEHAVAADLAATFPFAEPGIGAHRAELEQLGRYAFARACAHHPDPGADDERANNERFRAGIVGLLLFYERRARAVRAAINAEVLLLQQISAAARDAPDAAPDFAPLGEHPIGLLGWYRAAAQLGGASVGGDRAPELGGRARARCAHCSGRQSVFIGLETTWRCLTCGGDRPSIERAKGAPP